jgi:hypothetical protein
MPKRSESNQVLGRRQTKPTVPLRRRNEETIYNAGSTRADLEGEVSRRP